MSNKLIYILQIQLLFECKSNLTKENYSAHETRKIYREMAGKKSRIMWWSKWTGGQAIRAETILTFKNTFGNIWKKLEVTFGLRLIYEQSLREIHLIGWRLAFSF